jgi:cyclic beta-1,2-glucan synthetase
MRYALLHWRFFDRFVGEDTQWLVPDNFQEDPTPVVAMRTSPTNIGLQLLAIGSAHDLGFITPGDMTRRLELAFRSLERMRRFRGHFFNWYDLNDLEVLEPAYVSTVDSGNLAGHLLAVRQACLSAKDVAADERAVSALRVSLRLASERLRPSPPRILRPGSTVARSAGEQVRLARTVLEAAADGPVTDAMLVEVAAAIRSAARAGKSPPPAAGGGAGGRVDRLEPAQDRGAPRPAFDSAGGDRRPPGGPRRAGPRLRDEMDFRFLFDEERELFSIGYRLDDARPRSASYYDLFASEARLASFVAIAKNDVPVDHWFRLGRSLTHAGGETALVSWSGSMFEYLMPALVMRSFPATVLDQTLPRRRAAADRLRGRARGALGVSESAYNLRDRHLTYQYRAFGVPDLALKRGLGRDLVIAPYASALAVMVDPQRALDNLDALEELGRWGRTASATPSTTRGRTRAGASPWSATTWRTTWG